MKRRRFLNATLAAITASVVAGCGFQLRRLEGIPFASLYINAPPNSSVAGLLRKALASGAYVRLADQAGEAEVVLKLAQERRSKIILSLSGAGRVREYRLGYHLIYSATGKDGRVWIAPDSIELSRDLTYDDAALLAKGAEENLLYRDMEDDATHHILRRLRSLKGAQQDGGRSLKAAQPVESELSPKAPQPETERAPQPTP